MSERPPNGPSDKGGGKKSGGFWGFVNKVMSNVSVDVSIGGAPAPRAPRGNPTDPAARMEPVRQDRKETYEELIYRSTNGAQGQAPMVRVDRERARVARSLDSRTGANGDGAAIPKSGGAPLPKDVRSRMEPRLGADLSQVKVHAGGDSSNAASALGAKAFTVGNDVHFGSGQLAPGTKEGDRLLAHELTHVVQGQKSGVQRKPEAGAATDGEQAVSQPHEPAEREADRVGDSVADSLHGGGDHSAGHDAHGKDAGHGTHTDGNAASEGNAKDAAAAGAPAQKPAAISAKLESGAVPSSAGFDPRKLFRKPASAAGATPTAGASPPAAAGKDAPAPRPPVTVPFDMAGAPHQLFFEPAGDDVQIKMASSEKLPFTDKFSKAQGAVDLFAQYVTTIEDPGVKAEFQTKLLPNLKRLSAQNVANFRTLYESRFPKKGGPGISNEEAKAGVNALIAQAQQQLAALVQWGASTGINDLSKESVDARMETVGAEVWRAQFTKTRDLITNTISAFKYKGTSKIDFTGSAKTGYRGPHKGQTRFNLGEFDVDLYTVHKADFDAAARKGAQVVAGKIFPTDRLAPKELSACSQQVVAALVAALPGIQGVAGSTVVLKGS